MLLICCWLFYFLCFLPNLHPPFSWVCIEFLMKGRIKFSVCKSKSAFKLYIGRGLIDKRCNAQILWRFFAQKSHMFHEKIVFVPLHAERMCQCGQIENVGESPPISSVQCSSISCFDRISCAHWAPTSVIHVIFLCFFYADDDCSCFISIEKKKKTL